MAGWGQSRRYFVLRRVQLLHADCLSIPRWVTKLFTSDKVRFCFAYGFIRLRFNLIFILGHELYLDAVKQKKLYKINQRSLPWHSKPIHEQELVKIISINYEIKPPIRLYCLKVIVVNSMCLIMALYLTFFLLTARTDGSDHQIVNW